MKEKQFDHIDHKIREAAENYQPDFDEENWGRMEALLDKEKNRRRPFTIWWVPAFILLTLAIATGYFYLQPENKQVAANEYQGKKLNEKTEIVIRNIRDSKQNEKYSDQSLTATTEKIINFKENDDVENKNASPVENITGTIKKEINALMPPPFVDENSGRKNNKGKTETQSGIHISPATFAEFPGTGGSGQPDERVHLPFIQAENPEVKEVEIALSEKNIPAVDSSTLVININNNDVIKATATKKQVVKTVQSKFYLVVAGGLETSGTRPLPKNAKLNMRYGAGIGYQLSSGLAVQSGFYVSRKKYSAGPEDYHPKEGSYWTIVTINNIDANCQIFEIPLSLKYEFPHTQTLSLVIGAGLTSYILKSEIYDYNYTRNGNAYTHKSGYTGNSSLFAVLDLSAGVNKRISKVLTVTTSSNLSVPLKGVGDGSVKLYSLGMEVGIKFQPVFKKNK